MKIRYTDIELKSNLKMSKSYLIGGLVFELVTMLISDSSKLEFSVSNSQGFFFIAFGVFMYLTNYIMIKRGYASIKGDILKRNNILNKKLNLTNIDTVRKFAGDYIFKKSDKELFRIETQRCNPEDIIVLNEELDQRNIKWQ